ncbi:MAG: hypothetical protein Q8O67_01535 [Deltaproteobacteria bacterium]|nr:hypothetical protein [Deltaproteobacteria bacterium]
MSASISEQLVHLAELARLDQRAKVVADKLENLPQPAKKADVAATKLKADLDAAHVRKSAALLAKKQGENEITEERHKIRKWESRANELKGEREHAALGSEIGTAKRQIKQLEDTVLEHMEALEQVDKDIAALEKKHTTALADAKAEWAKVDDDLKALRTEFANFGVGKKALLDQLPAPVIKRYEVIANKRQGVGVAIITPADNCDACHRAVPPQLIIQIMKGQLVESCPACNRLLVHHSMTRVEAGSTP